MSLTDGQIIEACLYLLDQEPHPHPVFGCPAISIRRAAEQLFVHESTLTSRQVVQAIAPLAETLFPSPRMPIPKVYQGERWIVFDSPAAKRLHRRNTLIGRPPLDPPAPALPLPAARKGTRTLQLSPPRRTTSRPPLPSAPLRKSSSDELMAGLHVPLPTDPGSAAQPNSAGVGKRSFLRPFLLGSKKKQAVRASADSQSAESIRSSREGSSTSEEGWTHITQLVDRAPSTEVRTFDTPASTDVSSIVDDYLQDTAPVIDSPYEDTAFISASPPTASHPLRQSTVPLRPKPRHVDVQSIVENTNDEKPLVARAPEDQLAARSLSSEPPEQPTMSIEAETVVKPSPAATDPIVGSELPSPVSTNVESAGSPHVQTIQHQTEVTSEDSPKDTSSSHRNSKTHRTHREREGHARREASGERQERRRDDGHRRSRDHHHHHHRSESESGDHVRRARKREEVGSRSRRDPKPPVKQTWIEGVFDGLPFGPNRTSVRIAESMKKDWRLFLAEIVALIGLAYVLQASGW